MKIYPCSPRLFFLLLCIPLSCASLAQAQADWYMVDTQVGNNNWNSVSSSAAYKHWADIPAPYNYDDNVEHFATAMDANASYQVDAGKLLRTVGITSGTDVFGGGP